MINLDQIIDENVCALILTVAYQFSRHQSTASKVHYMPILEYKVSEKGDEHFMSVLPLSSVYI